MKQIFISSIVIFVVSLIGCKKSGKVDQQSSSETKVVTVTSKTGKIWMDRNLGASRVATSSTDTASYGDLYQWGRGTDGHQKRTSATTTTLSTSDVPGNAKFIVTSLAPYNWRSPKNDNLWQGVNGINNPCPVGFRLPTEEEWRTEIASWTIKNAEGAFSSPLKLPMAGRRYQSTVNYAGSVGEYWTSTVSSSHNPSTMYFTSNEGGNDYYFPVFALCVRCIKN